MSKNVKECRVLYDVSDPDKKTVDGYYLETDVEFLEVDANVLQSIYNGVSSYDGNYIKFHGHLVSLWEDRQTAVVMPAEVVGSYWVFFENEIFCKDWAETQMQDGTIFIQYKDGEDVWVDVEGIVLDIEEETIPMIHATKITMTVPDKNKDKKYNDLRIEPTHTVAEIFEDGSIGIEFNDRYFEWSFQERMRNMLMSEFTNFGWTMKNDFLAYYKNNIKTIDDVTQKALPRFTNIIQKAVSAGVHQLIQFKIDYYAEEELIELMFEDFDIEQYLEPIGNAIDEVQNYAIQLGAAREAQRMGRSRWQGGGFGVRGAIKGAIKAGAMNVATDAIRSIGDGIRNSADRNKVKTIEKERIQDPDNRYCMANGIFDSCVHLFYCVYRILIEEGVLTFVDMDTAQIDAKIKNYTRRLDENPEYFEKLREVYLDGIQEVPVRTDYYAELYDLLDIDDFELKMKLYDIAKIWSVDEMFAEMIWQSNEEELDVLKQLPENNLSEVNDKLSILYDARFMRRYYAIEDAGLNEVIGILEEIEKILREEGGYNSASIKGRAEINYKLRKLGEEERAKKESEKRAKEEKEEAERIKRQEKEDVVRALKKEILPIKQPIDDALKYGNIDFVWKRIEEGNGYAEYALEKYYFEMLEKCYPTDLDLAKAMRLVKKSQSELYLYFPPNTDEEIVIIDLPEKMKEKINYYIEQELPYAEYLFAKIMDTKICDLFLRLDAMEAKLDKAKGAGFTKSIGDKSMSSSIAYIKIMDTLAAEGNLSANASAGGKYISEYYSEYLVEESEKAVDSLMKAADGNHPIGSAYLGRCLEKGIPSVIDVDKETAEELLTIATIYGVDVETIFFRKEIIS